MPFIGKLRKDLTVALTERVIPALQTPELPLVYVEFPLRVPGSVRWWKISDHILCQSEASHERWGADEWPDEGLIASNYPYLGFVLEGTAHLRIGLSREQADRAGEEMAGIYALELPAPCVVFYPPGTIHHNGSRPFWEKAGGEAPGMQFLSLRAFSSALLGHLCHDEGGQHFVEHPLQISDPHLLALMQLFADELQRARQEHQQTAQACLLTLMLRLKRYIDTAPIANTSWPVTPGVESQEPTPSPSKVLFGLAINYIQLRMHEKLTLARIAQGVGVTPQHLNRVFHQTAHTSVMRYVTSQRIEAARQILVAGQGEPIQEVARLVGFERYSTFSRAFVRELHFSPRACRQEAHAGRINKSEPDEG